MFRSRLIPDRDQFVALELQQLAAPRAVQMVVLGVAVVVVVDGSPVELEAIEQTGVNALTQGAIHRRRADIVFLTTTWKPIDQFFRIEVVVLAKHLIDQVLSLAGLTQPPRLEVLREAFLRRQGYLQRFDLGRDRLVRISVGIGG